MTSWNIFYEKHEHNQNNTQNTEIPTVRKCTVSAEFEAILPVFLPNVCTRKLDEITVFYAVEMNHQQVNREIRRSDKIVISF